MSDKSNKSKKSFVRVVNKFRYGRPINDVWNGFAEYSESSTIHGVRYLGQTKLHWFERLWWVISLTISIIVCIYFVYQVYTKLKPVIISFDDEATQISQIPFPTITICGDVRVSPSVLNYTSNLDNIEKCEYKYKYAGNYYYTDYDYDYCNFSVDVVQEMHSLAQFCYLPEEMHDKFMYNYVKHKNITIDRNVLPHLERVLPKIFQYSSCSLDERHYSDCSLLFSQILTDEGLCYTFNHLSTREIYREKELSDDFPMVESFQPTFFYDVDYRKITFPYRMQVAGAGIILEISLPKNERYFDQYCSDMYSRNCLKMQVHAAEEVPLMRKNFYSIPLNHNVHITVTPNRMSTDPVLIDNYSKDDRKCISEKENELRFFSKYTESNCHLEVLVNQTLQHCNCSFSWMPRSNGTEICRIGMNSQCFRNVKVTANLTSKCFPACDSTSYDVDIDTMPYMKLDYDNDHLLVLNDSMEYDIVMIKIAFKKKQYFFTKRSESYGKIDVIAGCGGILGLFMGISFLSIIEIVYFTTLRVFCNLRKDRPAAAVQLMTFKTIENVEISDNASSVSSVPVTVATVQLMTVETMESEYTEID